MKIWSKVSWGFLAGLACGLLVVVGIALGALVAARQGNTSQLVFPETAIHASASQAGKTMAVATGLVDSNVEGLFTLDFLTGDLQCTVISVRGQLSHRFSGVFKTNIVKDLGIGAVKPDYLMVTGAAKFRGAAGQRPGVSVVYVIDASTGNFVAYGIPWNSTIAATGGNQQGPLFLLDRGQARTATIRDQ